MFSGTHLIRYEILNRSYASEDDYERKFGVGTDNKLIGFHLDVDPQLYYYQLKKYKVIVPLRHPRRILESFNRRDKPISNYHQQWKHMLMLPVYKPVYVHVDNKRSRNRQVKAIGKLLNMELSTAWPLSERSGSKYGTHDIPLKDCPEAPQEYIDFYENTL